MSPEQRHADVLATMKLAPVIPVLTVRNVADGVAQARALVAGGLYAIEVTLRTSAALEAIAEIAKSVPGAHVGAGTIVEPSQIDAAVEAGAKFLVSPGASPKLAAAAAAASIPFLPGIATASEAMALRDLGFRAMKLFPAEAVGGARLLASLHAPLADLVFCPTGGIDLAKAPTYLALPNVLCVGGSWMLPKAALESGDYAKVEALSREAAALAR
jgi:2-dehydro-3-deoxyphosphogluconate aldolase/(4S)-4-hydroxy-2-oxoglutarate aldolase